MLFTPINVMNNHPHSGIIDAKHFAKMGLSITALIVQMTDFIYLRLSKHCTRIPFSKCGSFLGGAVAHIILICAEKQMRWITAFSVIAMMAHKHAFWDFTIGQFSCYTMGIQHFVIQPDSAITIGFNSNLPFPTFIRVGSKANTRPKTIYLFWGILRGRHGLTPVSHAPAIASSVGILFDTPLYHKIIKFERQIVAQEYQNAY